MHESEHSEEPKKDENELKKWLNFLKNGIKKGTEGEEGVPEQIEHAANEAAEESVDTAHDLSEYMKKKLLSSDVLKSAGVIVHGGSYVEFPSSGKVINLGLPDHNFYTKYGFRAEGKGRTIDVKLYVDAVVADIEMRALTGQEFIRSYELAPLRESIEQVLMKERGFSRGAELNQLARGLEERATQLLHNLHNSLSIKQVSLDGITLSRVTDYGSIRFFDVECYL